MIHGLGLALNKQTAHSFKKKPNSPFFQKNKQPNTNQELPERQPESL
jgi:hypothetical protein